MNPPLCRGDCGERSLFVPPLYVCRELQTSLQGPRVSIAQRIGVMLTRNGCFDVQDPNNEEQRTMYRVRRAAVDYNLPIITNPKVAQLLVKSLATVNELSADSFQDIKAKIGK
eukprot:m.1475917 g.1475917  ORF g.1475917 m.1475917 type:complete len:113 (+) comp25156_c0_seq10:182-520(+)